jgi:hypothetical protein
MGGQSCSHKEETKAQFLMLLFLLLYPPSSAAVGQAKPGVMFGVRYLDSVCPEMRNFFQDRGGRKKLPQAYI